jgi:hypothetical protein
VPVFAHEQAARLRRWRAADGEVLRISESTLDLQRQTCTVRFTVACFGQGPAAWRYEEEHVNRFFSVPEMRLFFTSAGLVPLAEHAGFSEDAALDDRAWHVVAVGQRPPDKGGVGEGNCVRVGSLR